MVGTPRGGVRSSRRDDPTFKLSGHDFVDMKPTVAAEEVSSHGVEKCAERHKCQRRAPFGREKPRADWKKGLANLRRRKIIGKKLHAGRGQETKWEIPTSLVGYRVFASHRGVKALIGRW